jgi:transmembrane sensor
MQHLVTKEILFSYFAGEVTALQKQIIEEWSKAPANQERFYEWLHEWEIQFPRYSADVPGALQRFIQRLSLFADNDALQ